MDPKGKDLQMNLSYNFNMLIENVQILQVYCKFLHVYFKKGIAPNAKYIICIKNATIGCVQHI